LDNACEYTESGYIVLYVTEIRRDEGSVLVRFSVRDTGVGITEDHKKTVFQTFHQAESFFNREHQGLGLGLSTASACLKTMGANINFKSTPGKGSVFYFDLWMPFGEVEQPRRVANGQLSELKILFAEDNPVNQLVTKKMLERQKMQVDLASNGQECIDMVKERQYDMILMDCSMPIVSGFEATQKIRGLGFAELPIIAVTANAMEGDRERCLNAGMNDYIAKPINVDELMATIYRNVKNDLRETG